MGLFSRRLVQIKGAKGVKVGPAGIEERQDMGDALLAVEAQVVDTANRQLEWHQPPGKQSHPAPPFVSPAL